MLEHRILLRRVEIRRLDQHRLEREAVLRLHLHELGLRELVVLQRRDLVRVDDAELSAVRLVQPRLRGRVASLHVPTYIVSDGLKLALCVPAVCDETREAGAVELDAVDVAADRAALRAGEVDPAGCLVDAVEGPDLPLAAGDLA